MSFLLATITLTTHARFTAPAAKRCGGIHAVNPALIALNTQRILTELNRFRLEFSRENGPQEVFVVGVGEKTASLIATLQTVSPDYAVNLPLRLSPSVKEYRDLSREDVMKISDYLESKLPKLRMLAHRTLLLIDTNPERLPLLREIFERYYRQYGIRVYVESQALTAGLTGPDRFALSPELAFEIQDGVLAEVREHRAFDLSQQKFLDQALSRDADYDAIAKTIHVQMRQIRFSQ